MRFLAFVLKAPESGRLIVLKVEQHSMGAKIADLRKIAEAFRAILEVHALTTFDVQFNNFPNGACGASADLLGRYLRQGLGLDAQYVSAERDEDNWSHAWTVIDGIIIDITADQFQQPPVVVTRQSAWHEAWKVEPPRPPICCQQQWPMYPLGTWKAILNGMATRGFRLCEPRCPQHQ